MLAAERTFWEKVTLLHAEAPGTLKLMPEARRMAALKADYGKMTPMFFEAPPPFDEIMKRMASLERAINESRA